MGLKKGEGNGRGPPGPVTNAQMVDKHPVVKHTFDSVLPRPQGADEQDLGMCARVIKTTKPIIGVGSRGLRPAHIKALLQGSFREPDATEAYPRFIQLGCLYLDGTLPPWV